MSALIAVQAVVQSLYDRHGYATPSALLDEAAPVDSPAHGAFQWDDALAGREYRLNQARCYIRVVVVETEHGMERVVHVPSIRGGEGQYKPISIVVAAPDEFGRALGEAQGKLNAASQAVLALQSALPDEKRSRLIKRATRGLGVADKALRMASDDGRGASV